MFVASTVHLASFAVFVSAIGLLLALVFVKHRRGERAFLPSVAALAAVLLLLVSGLPLGLLRFGAGPSFVGTITNEPFWYPTRNLFRASGRWWLWYSDGENMVYRTSADGSDWSGPTAVAWAPEAYYFVITFDGTYFHYARTDLSDYDMYYRRGKPNSDGTISWSADEQLVYDGSIDDHRVPRSIAVDSGGHAWIAVTGPGPSGEFIFLKVIKNSRNDGTWSTEREYDIEGSIGSFVDEASIIALANSKMYVVYSRTVTGNVWYPMLYGRLWDGSWGPRERISPYPLISSCHHSVVADGDNVHTAYIVWDVSGVYLAYRMRGSGGWGGEELFQKGPSDITSPYLSIDPATGYLYCFWVDEFGYLKCSVYIEGRWSGLSLAADIKPCGITVPPEADNGEIGVAYYVCSDDIYETFFTTVKTVPPPSPPSPPPSPRPYSPPLILSYSELSVSPRSERVPEGILLTLEVSFRDGSPLPPDARLTLLRPFEAQMARESATAWTVLLPENCAGTSVLVRIDVPGRASLDISVPVAVAPPPHIGTGLALLLSLSFLVSIMLMWRKGWG